MNSNLSLFYGENQTALKKEVNIWKTAFFKKYPDSSNFSEFKDPINQISQIKNEIQTPPFLGEKRLIFVYNLNPALDTKVVKLLTDLPETSIVLIIEETKLAKNAKVLTAIKKIGNVKEFSSSNLELQKTAQQLLAKLGVNMDQFLLRELIQKLENNPAKIENEICKLALFCTDNIISQSDIQQLVKFSVTISVFDLIDNISAKKIQLALKNLSDMMDSGEEPTKVFYLLARQIRILIQLKSLKDKNTPENQIAKLSGLHPFIVKKTLPTLRNFSNQQLAKTLEKILDIDTKLKTGGIKYSKNEPTELLINLEMTIIDLCR
jgi:DNA polymerase-3 subunit delta